MQLLFGAIGPHLPAITVFRRLSELSRASNPGLEITGPVQPDLLVGYAARQAQSWSSPDGTLVMHLDGEIRAASACDPATVGPELLRLLAEDYRRDPAGFWERIDGSFCLVIRDGASLSIGVDVAGTRAAYWWVDGPVLAFHSHLMDLAPAFPRPLTDDLGAIGNYLAAGSYPAGRTPFREIGHVGAGQVIQFDGKRAVLRDHLEMSYRPADAARRHALVDELIDLLSASIAAARQAMDRPIIPISGGLDSRYLLAEFVRQVPDSSRIRTITWGEEPDRPGSDAVVAPQVAAALGVEHQWRSKAQWPDPETFARALYLSSGEADCAIQYPDDHLLHAELAGESFRSLLRGDECFGAGPSLMTRQAVLAVNGIARLGWNPGYRSLVPAEVLTDMAAEQEADLSRMLGGLRSSTPTGARDEIYYQQRVRRVLAVYNRVKHTDLEVFTPYLARPVLEWLRSTPDHLRADKALLRTALARRFPRLARLPFATADNLPRWSLRAARNPRLALFYREWCAMPGWLESIGSRGLVVGSLSAMADAAARSGGGPAFDPDRGSARWRELAKRTLPGRLARELTLDRRYPANNVPAYLRLARLAVLHGLLGEIRRRAVWTASSRP